VCAIGDHVPARLLSVLWVSMYRYTMRCVPYTVDKKVMELVGEAVAKHARVVVLTDSDTAGRQLRSR